AGPVIGRGRDGKAITGLAVGDPAPGQGVLIEAHDADQIRRLLLDDDKPVFPRHLPKHRCGAIEIPGGAGVIAKAIGLVAPASMSTMLSAWRSGSSTARCAATPRSKSVFASGTSSGFQGERHRNLAAHSSASSQAPDADKARIAWYSSAGNPEMRRAKAT